MSRSTIFSHMVAVFSACALMSTTMLSTWPAQAQQASDSGAEFASAQEKFREISETLEQFYAGVEVVYGATDRSRFEIGALAEKLGPEPGALLAYVQSEIAFEPYVGSLRGAQGALGSGAANALDRSLLLAELLQRSGFTAEIARGRLDDGQALTLLQHVGQPRPAHPDPIQIDAAFLQDLVNASGINVDELLEVVQQLENQGQDISLELTERVAEDEAFLNDRFGEAGIVMPQATTLDALIPVVSDHFWVRYQDTDGNWIDLEPSFAGTEAGQAVAQFETAVPPNAVPEELVHTFSVRMKLRIASGDEVEDTVLVERHLAVPDVYGTRISVASVPLPLLTESMREGETIDEALASVGEIAAVVIVGSTPIQGRLFNAQGAIFDSLPGSETGQAERLASASGGGFAGLAGALDGGPSRRQIIEQWVEYELESPTVDGTKIVRREERSIYAAPPQGDQPDEAEILQHLIWSAELLPMTGPMHADQLGHLQVSSFLAGREAAMLRMRQMMGLPVDLSTLVESGVVTPSLALFAAALSEGATAIRAERFLNLGMIWDRPQLVAYETRIVPGADQPTAISEGFDIVALAPKIIALQPDADAGGFATAFGALSNALEWSIMEHRYNQVAEFEPAPTANTGEVFRAANAQNVEIVTLQPGDEGAAALAGLGLPPSELELMGKALEDGDVIIAPVSPVMVAGANEPWSGWWQVDPQTGEIIGVMQGGRGAGTSYTLLLNSLFVGVGATGACLVAFAIGGVIDDPAVWFFCVFAGYMSFAIPAYGLTIGEAAITRAMLTILGAGYGSNAANSRRVREDRTQSGRPSPVKPAGPPDTDGLPAPVGGGSAEIPPG